MVRPVFFYSYIIHLHIATQSDLNKYELRSFIRLEWHHISTNEPHSFPRLYIGKYGVFTLNMMKNFLRKAMQQVPN